MKYIEENKTKTKRITICLSQEDIDYIENKKNDYGFRSVSAFIRECVYDYDRSDRKTTESI